MTTQEAGKIGGKRSADLRLRDLRKPRNGRLTVERQHVNGGRWRYRVLPAVEGQASLFDQP